jgi:truncated hemoglobin YjbI
MVRPMVMTAFERIGARELEKITLELVERMQSDLMIGFHFKRVDPVRLAELEYQHAAELLGGPVHYEGRPLGAAHAPHKIAGGHFSRRKELLRQILERHAVPTEVAQLWLDGTEALRAEIVGTQGECH